MFHVKHRRRAAPARPPSYASGPENAILQNNPMDQKIGQ